MSQCPNVDYRLPVPFFVFLCFAWISNPDLYLISFGRPFVMEQGGFLTWVCVLAVPDPTSEFSDDGPMDEGTLDVRGNLCKASSASLFLISSSSLFRAFLCFSATLAILSLLHASSISSTQFFVNTTCLTASMVASGLSSCTARTAFDVCGPNASLASQVHHRRMKWQGNRVTTCMSIILSMWQHTIPSCSNLRHWQ